MIHAEIEFEKPNKITLRNMPKNMIELCNSIPGMNWDRKTELWYCPIGWANCLALRNTFGDKLEIGPVLDEWARNDAETRREPALRYREAIETAGPEWLFPFQRAGVKFLRHARRAILADEMGLGKTVQSIATLLEHYIRGEEIFPVLVVCPNSTKTNWKREFDRFWPGLEVTIINGTSTQRRKQLKTPSHVYVINFESVRSHSRLAPYGSTAFTRCEACGGKPKKKPVSESQCHTHIKELNLINFNAVIVDEIHRMKDPASQQTRAIKSATGNADIRIGLSGTPIANSPDDLWSALNWLSPEEHPSKVRHIQRLLEYSYDYRGNKHVTGIRHAAREEYFNFLDPRLRRMPKELVLPQLPPIVREVRHVEMKPVQRKAYEQMRDTMLAELESGDVMVTTSPLTRTLRMLQFASSYADLSIEDVWDEEEQVFKKKTKVTLAPPSNKVDAFMTDIPDFGTDQVAVFAASRQLIELLSDRLNKHDINHGLITGKITTGDRQEYIDQFQDGKIQFILCTSGAGGTGINLTAANTAAFLQRPWSMIESNQAEGRVRRIGSEIHESITYIDYISPGTMDEVVVRAIEDKSDRLEAILRDKDLLRRAIEGDL